MLTFKYVYDSQSSTKLRDQLTEMAGYCFNLETFDINHYKERKKAFKIKGSCSARENPFLAVYDNDLLVNFIPKLMNVNLKLLSNGSKSTL